MRLYRASGLNGSTVATASRPATARRFLPCTPSPTTITRIGHVPSLVADFLLDRVDFLQYLLGGDGPIAVVLALHSRGDAAEDGSDDIALRRHHRERRVGEQRVTRADRIGHPVGETLDREE